jgi:5-methylthioribose kinase
MLELTPNSAEAYLRERNRIPPGPVRVSELIEGVSNAVLCVETTAGKFVLKQSRPQLRTRDAWFSDIARIWRERDAMQLLRPLMPAGVVPEILWSDEENFAFAMSHAPAPFRNWRTVLLSGEVDLALGETAGRLLGAIHEHTARRIDSLDAFSDRTVFEQLRVEPFYLRVRKRCPDVADALEPLIERCRTERLGLSHGDFSPKNLLLHSSGFTLVDYETCHVGDVTFDLGFFLCHLMLKSVYVSRSREVFHDLTRSFWRGYSETVSFAPKTKLINAGIGHLGGCLLARVDGASPAPYLTDEAHRDAIRRLARGILRERPATWEQLLELAQ